MMNDEQEDVRRPWSVVRGWRRQSLAKDHRERTADAFSFILHRLLRWM